MRSYHGVCVVSRRPKTKIAVKAPVGSPKTPRAEPIPFDPPPSPLTPPDKVDLAAKHNVSIRQVENWLAMGLPSRLEKRKGRPIRVFDAAEADAWIAANRDKRGTAATGDGERAERKARLDEAEIKRRELDAEKRALELALRRGEVLMADEVERGRVARVAAVTAALEALPAAIAPVLEGRGVQEIQAVLSAEVRRIRAEFAGEAAA
jgi:hypothetical protein